MQLCNTELAPFLLPHDIRHDHKQKKISQWQRVVSESNAFVSRLPKNECFRKMYNKTNHKKLIQLHAITKMPVAYH